MDWAFPPSSVGGQWTTLGRLSGLPSGNVPENPRITLYSYFMVYLNTIVTGTDAIRKSGSQSFQRGQDRFQAVPLTPASSAVIGRRCGCVQQYTLS